ncbi:MAG: pyridoxamine 5'-phosphate oxidase family protein [Lachnospiraceae bacterium]|nr:pyridoxamine 5'-phosphate oxidase family protein [Lachnospiraceae bacterium]
MAVINEHIRELLSEPDTLKLLATVSADGTPHAAYKGTLRAEGDELVYYDLLQSSETNKNLVHALWFDKKVSVTVLSKDREVYQIIGRPERCITAGGEFEKVYRSLRERMGDTDLNAIWYIRPEKIRDNSLKARKQFQAENFPVLTRLDMILKEDE